MANDDDFRTVLRITKELSETTEALRRVKIGVLTRAFEGCPLFASGREYWQRLLSGHFEVTNDGEVWGYRDAETRRKPIFKRDSPGTPAAFDEAVEQILANLSPSLINLAGEIVAASKTPLSAV